MDTERLRACRVLPVVTAGSVACAVQLARSLHAGGMQAIEITLRSDSALAAIEAVMSEVPGMLVAAGTVNSADDLDSVRAAGARLALSPGSTESLLRAAASSDIDFIPGVATASELMRGLDHGFEVFKLFPAEASGGKALLKAFAGPFPQVQFCPTGGLNMENFRDYLALPNVICCGGSWMVAQELVDNERWAEIESLASEAMAI
jgi:2-dehydro-3-deoxyphosphogluconate aldolase/(4S)-4-hydroxy-2-oxoglutarate aldolase